MTFDPNARYLGQPSFMLDPPFLAFALFRDEESGRWGAWLTMNGFVIGQVNPRWPCDWQAADAAFCSLQRLEARHGRA